MNQDLYCQYCKYSTKRLCDYNKHLNTNKHYKNFNIDIHDKKKIINNKECICGRYFSYLQGLYRHRQKCQKYIEYNNNSILNISKIITDNKFENHIVEILVNQLQKKDEQVDKLINELIQIKNTVVVPQNTITGNNNNIINNTNVNMALFLDNYCKNAVNMSDFMKSMEVQVSDLLHTKDNGIIKGITNIFLNKLKQLDIYERPIHCTDLKRLTMYVKDNDVWHEGETGKQKISDTIQNISALQIKKIPEWESEVSEELEKEDLDDEYMKIVNTACKNIGEKEEEKILRTIAKDVALNKKNLEINN